MADPIKGSSCDRCGELVAAFEGYVEGQYTRSFREHEQMRPENSTLTLCGECARDFDQFLDGVDLEE